MTTARTWLQASRPLSQLNIAPPLLLGQLWAAETGAELDAAAALATFAYGVLAQLVIVYTNDWSDEASDRHHPHPTPISGGSRVLPEGRLSAKQLGRAAVIATAALLALGGTTALLWQRPLMGPWTLAGLASTWAYSLRPFRLSHRGHGEWLQGLGVGVILPLVGYTMQLGQLARVPWPALLPAFLLGYAGNISTSLPDYDADRVIGKRSYAVRRGERRAARESLLFIGTAVVTSAALATGELWVRALMCLPALALLAHNAAVVHRAKAGHPRVRFGFALRNVAAITAQWLAWCAMVVWA